MKHATDLALDPARKSGHEHAAHAKTHHNGQAHGLADAFRKEGEALKHKAVELKDKASDKLEETLHDVKAKTSEAQAVLVHYVKEHPFKALGWAALAGAVVGILLRK